MLYMYDIRPHISMKLTSMIFKHRITFVEETKENNISVAWKCHSWSGITWCWCGLILIWRLAACDDPFEQVVINLNNKREWILGSEYNAVTVHNISGHVQRRDLLFRGNLT